MTLITTVERLEAALDELDTEGLAYALGVLIDLLGPRSALTIAKALLNERGMYHPRPFERPSATLYA